MREILAAIVALATFASPSTASAKLLINVNKSAQTLTVLRDGRALYAWPVSTGKTDHETPTGSFTAFRMEADHFSKEWDDAPMPHSIFFTKQGHAIHGSFDVKRLGSPVSHGCVRLAPDKAAILFALVGQEGLPNTQIVLTGSEQVAIQRLNALRTTVSEPSQVRRDYFQAQQPPNFRERPRPSPYYYFDPYDGQLRSLKRYE
jgi:hypothetical protein